MKWGRWNSKPAKETSSKYLNRKVELDGYTFDSKAEAARYSHLLWPLKAGQIKELEVHKRFVFMIDDKKICAYEADFCYKEKQKDGTWIKVAEDVKSEYLRKTNQAYNIKKKLFLALYPDWKFVEVDSKSV